MPLMHEPDSDGDVANKVIELPLFDISRETPELGKAIVDAAAKWGFLWIAGSPAPKTTSKPDTGDGESTPRPSYDLDEELVDRVFGVSRKFFKDAPASEKQACSIKDNMGFVGMHVENLDPATHKRGDFKQAFNLSRPDPVTGSWLQPLPATLLEEETLLREFHDRCQAMTIRLLRLLALGLSVEDVDWFTRSHIKAPNTARLLFYPALPPDSDYSKEADIRAGAHSDYGSITLLFTRPDQPGLEILSSDGATWTGVPVFPADYHSKTFPPVVVNIGDLLSHWTNGLLKSTVHRVVVPQLPPPSTDSSSQASTNGSDSEASRRGGDESASSDRLSIALFVHPEEDAMLIPIPSPLVQKRAADFKGKAVGHGGGAIDTDSMTTLTAGQYLNLRLKATYV